jgi:hypothetical protein
MRPRRIEFSTIEITREAYRIVIAEKGRLLFAGGVFFLFSLVLKLFAEASGSPAIVAFGADAAGIAKALGAIACGMLACANAIGVHAPFLPSAIINHRPFWGYVLATIVVFFSIVAATFLSAFLTMPLVGFLQAVSDGEVLSVILVFMFYILAGFAGVWASVNGSLVAPAKLAGERISIRGSWVRTKGMGFRLLAAYALAIFPFVVLTILAGFCRGRAGSLEVMMLLSILISLINFTSVAVWGALSGAVFARVVQVERAFASVEVAPVAQP